MTRDIDYPRTIVSFGTSLTARGGWQASLAKQLSSCLGRPVSVETVAQSGATSAWGLDHIDAVMRFRPDVVVIEFYANDAAIHRFTSVRQSRETIAKILVRLKAELPQARLILQVMNPFWGTRRMIRPFLDSYIDEHLREAAVQNVEIVDHRPVWSALGSEMLATSIPDGAHPLSNAASTVIVPTLARQIGGSGCF